MKSKIHIDINTYEFIEVEQEGEFSEGDIVRLHNKYHKLIAKAAEGKVVKQAKHEADFVNDLPEPDEPIIID